MSKDFRDELVEMSRSDEFGRWFKEINVANAFLVSIQASDVHGSIPAEVLDDVREYEAFEVSLRQVGRNIMQDGYGAWDELQEKEWADLFTSRQPIIISGDEIPTATVQQIMDDLVAYSVKHFGAGKGSGYGKKK